MRPTRILRQLGRLPTDAAAEGPPPFPDRHVMQGTSELAVALRLGSEPIAGEIRLPDGSTTVFQGYMQLIAVVERARGMTNGKAAEAEQVRRRGAG